MIDIIIVFIVLLIVVGVLIVLFWNSFDEKPNNSDTQFLSFFIDDNVTEVEV